MANIRSEIVGQSKIGQLREGLDKDSFDIVDGLPMYLRHSHKDKTDPDCETYVVYGDDEYGPHPTTTRLLHQAPGGIPAFIVPDTEGLERLFTGKKAHILAFDIIDDDTVHFDEAGEPYFRAMHANKERVVHGSWQSLAHDSMGTPLLHKGRILYVGTDDHGTFLFCKGEEILEGHETLWLTGVEGDEVICATIEDKTILELRVRID